LRLYINTHFHYVIASGGGLRLCMFRAGSIEHARKVLEKSHASLLG